MLDLKQRYLIEGELSKLDGNFKSAHENYRYDAQRKVSVMRYNCGYKLCFKIFKNKNYLDVHLGQHKNSTIAPTPYFKSLFETKCPSRGGFLLTSN